MAIKKSELYSTLWASCDELRGGMDASQYKDYVLVMLFVKYVSDKYSGDPSALIEVPSGGSFNDMVKLKGTKDIGDNINKIIAKLAEANDLKGIIDVADFNDEDKLGKGKEMQDRLSNLVGIFENPALDFSRNRAEGDDILGDAYEYLMRHFATESGKSKGQFYTPAEVSRIIAKVIGVDKAYSQDQTIYDPTCGSGSLLLKAADETPLKVTIYGQEKDVATAALAKMNMILHNNPTAEITKGQSTLSNPLFLKADKSLKTFDFVVANPPFSSKNWSTGFNPVNDEYDRFKGFGIPPAKNGDFAFLLHIIRSIRSRGKGACILPHGVLFRGNAEAEIRKNIILRGYIKGIISLPANLFYGTGIPACIIVLDKENSESRRGIFMIDASKGFVKDGNKNRLREQDIHKIVDIFNKQIEISKYSRMASFVEIETNDFNLNIPRYIDCQEPEDTQDIRAHLQGGIPDNDIEALHAYWDVYPDLRADLFAPSGRNGYSVLKPEPKHIRITIFSHPQFIAYANHVHSVFDEWKHANSEALKKITQGDKPKILICDLSENLLSAFSGLKLIDRYDVYQLLMSYWIETMQDDVYDLVADGWKACNEVIVSRKSFEGRLIPKRILIDEYFAAEWNSLEDMVRQRDDLIRQREEIEEEFGGEDGVLDEARNEKGKINKLCIEKRLKELKKSMQPLTKAAEVIPMYSDRPVDNETDEVAILTKLLSLIEDESEISKRISLAQLALDKKLLAKYNSLTGSEVKTLLVDVKWMGHLTQDVQNALDQISQRLTQRLKELSDRYEQTLGSIAAEVEQWEKKVAGHLHKMGFEL